MVFKGTSFKLLKIYDNRLSINLSILVLYWSLPLKTNFVLFWILASLFSVFLVFLLSYSWIPLNTSREREPGFKPTETVSNQWDGWLLLLLLKSSSCKVALHQSSLFSFHQLLLSLHWKALPKMLSILFTWLPVATWRMLSSPLQPPQNP
jgi:hypothetical protein